MALRLTVRRHLRPLLLAALLGLVRLRLLLLLRGGGRRAKARLVTGGPSRRRPLIRLESAWRRRRRSAGPIGGSRGRGGTVHGRRRLRGGGTGGPGSGLQIRSENTDRGERERGWKQRGAMGEVRVDW